MADEPHKGRISGKMIAATVVAVLIILLGIVWLKLPAIAGYGLKYDWSREYSISTLRWLGPRAAGAVWEMPPPSPWIRLLIA